MSIDKRTCDLVITKIVREIFVRSSSICRTLGEHVVYKNCSERQNFFFAHTAYRKNNKCQKCVGMGLNEFHIPYFRE